MKIFSAEFVISAGSPEQFPRDARPHIAFAGRSNAGKSSLINALLHRKNLVKTSATPGKTQLVNFFIVNEKLYFVDLPGYGYARVPRAVLDTWPALIEGYLTHSPRPAGVVVLLDCRREPDERDETLVQWLGHYRIPAIYALTKTDKLNRRDAERAARAVRERFGPDAPLVITSAKNGTGTRELWAEINKRLG